MRAEARGSGRARAACREPTLKKGFKPQEEGRAAACALAHSGEPPAVRQDCSAGSTGQTGQAGAWNSRSGDSGQKKGRVARVRSPESNARSTSHGCREAAGHPHRLLVLCGQCSFPTRFRFIPQMQETKRPLLPAWERKSLSNLLWGNTDAGCQQDGRVGDASLHPPAKI